MTDPVETAPTAGDPFQSLTALRAAHTEFMRDRRKTAGRAADMASAIKTFLDRAQAAGAFIADEDERNRAQDILDYWSAELISALEEPDPTFTSAALVPFDASRAGMEVDHTEAKERLRRESAEVVRLAAQARQWRAWGKPEGQLLRGEALEQAAALLGADPDLDTFVAASEANEAAAKRAKKSRIWWTATGMSVTLIFVLVLHFFGLPALSKGAIWLLRSNNSTESQQHRLWRLSYYQKFMTMQEGAFDFSGIHFEDIELPGLQIYFPNFSQATFKGVNFSGARFPNASFGDTRFGVLVKKDKKVKTNDFSKASLEFSQFREARIASTSFAGATLYRATFDRACLSDVDFSGADVRAASFWAVEFNEGFEQRFRNTGWWLAAGWSSEQINKLLPLVPPARHSIHRKLRLLLISIRMHLRLA